jgi:hypothetical protein
LKPPHSQKFERWQAAESKGQGARARSRPGGQMGVIRTLFSGFTSMALAVAALIIVVYLAVYDPQYLADLSLFSQSVKNFMGDMIALIPGIGINLKAMFLVTIDDNQILWLTLFLVLQLGWSLFVATIRSFWG